MESPGTAPGSEPFIMGAFIAIVPVARNTSNIGPGWAKHKPDAAWNFRGEIVRPAILLRCNRHARAGSQRRVSATTLPTATMTGREVRRREVRRRAVRRRAAVSGCGGGDWLSGTAWAMGLLQYDRMQMRGLLEMTGSKTGSFRKRCMILNRNRKPDPSGIANPQPRSRSKTPDTSGAGRSIAMSRVAAQNPALISSNSATIRSRIAEGSGVCASRMPSIGFTSAATSSACESLAIPAVWVAA